MAAAPPRGGGLHRPDDALVAGAAAQVARQRLADLLLARRRVAPQQVLRGDDLPGDAEAALDRTRVQERLLQIGQPVRREAFDRRDLVPLRLRAEHEARIDGTAVEQHGARAALALGAAALRAGQPHLVAQSVEQRAVRRHGDRALAAVDRQRDGLQLVEPADAHVAILPDVRGAAAARTARLASTRTIAWRYSRLPRMSEIGVAISSVSSSARASPASSAASNGASSSVRSGRAATAPRPSTTRPSRPTPAATLTVARSTPRRRVSRRKAEPNPSGGRGRSIRVTSSSGPHSVRRGPRKKSSSGTVRSPARDAIVTEASCTSSAGTVSAAGDPLHALPTRLARLRMATEPTVSAASTSAGYRCRTTGCAASSPIVSVGPTRTPASPRAIGSGRSATAFRSTTSVGSIVWWRSPTRRSVPPTSARARPPSAARAASASAVVLGR